MASRKPTHRRVRSDASSDGGDTVFFPAPTRLEIDVPSGEGDGGLAEDGEAPTSPSEEPSELVEQYMEAVETLIERHVQEPRSDLQASVRVVPRRDGSGAGAELNEGGWVDGWRQLRICCASCACSHYGVHGVSPSEGGIVLTQTAAERGSPETLSPRSPQRVARFELPSVVARGPPPSLLSLGGVGVSRGWVLAMAVLCVSLVLGWVGGDALQGWQTVD